MPRGYRSWGAVLLSASALVAPQMAQAQTAREAALEERLARLETEMQALRSELSAARNAQAETAAAATEAASRSEEAVTRLAALEAKPSAPAEGFRVGGTTFKLGGFVKAVASATRYDDGMLAGGSLGKEFYLPQQIPVGGTSTRDFMANARQTRLFFTSSTPVAGKELKSHIEFDFALATAPPGAQRATNAYTPTLRRAFLTYDKFLIGQEWTTFQNPALLPESTDFVGPLEGTVFVRQMIVQYRQPLSPELELHLALENPQTETVNTTNAALADNDQDRVPDLVAKLVYKQPNLDLHVAGLVRQLSVHDGGSKDDMVAWGISAGGKFAFGPDKRHDVRFSATYGDGIGRYLGLGYAPDALYDRNVLGNRLINVGNFAGFASLKLGWTGNLRSTLAVGYSHADYPGGITVPGLANVSAYSAALNLFWSPVKNLDIGVEVRHAEREVANGLKGQMDRLEMAAKYTF
ncbi:DcaP family trimeric outer membrane transporter [Blastomonas sp. SL216]|uniref:DcaP family trimeric outer membrane transporter n=1 Tax=Blastomonas sp. SL216 TaxID=2995169 RepID=UPI0023777B8A|nr:DcaP family trimeric outer membrane transporter [Blastomonas sp. SL216]